MEEDPPTTTTITTTTITITIVTKEMTTTTGPLMRLRQYGLDVKVHSSPSTQARHDESLVRRASILILLSKEEEEEDEYRILMTQRSHQLRSHPGDVCFPGGKQDVADEGDDWRTAYRETQEEVGLDVGGGTALLITPLERLARLPTIESMHHLCVTPLVGIIDQPSSELDKFIHINPSEVEHSFWVPLRYFRTTKPKEEYDIPWQGEIFVFRTYMFPLDDGRLIPITGLTAHVAKQVADIAFPADEAPPECGAIITGTPTIPRALHAEHQGTLWRQQNNNNNNNNDHPATMESCWVKRYFVVSGGMLHQYDHVQAAERKSQSATKKHRLRLQNDPSVNVVLLDVGEQTNDVGPTSQGDTKRFPFQVRVLEGRIVWNLAASSDHERSLWKQWILDNII